ncbi:MAG TPA: hypothetical protein VFF06_03075 [Polyangia bacterium]|nr:hypothetical protein [Polyangia bacterium]
MHLRAWIVSSLLAAGCGHIAPATVEGVPQPWPAPDAPVSRKAEPPPPPVEPEGKPVVPPLKRESPVPPAPNQPQSPAG